jgi:hypothetical protein
MAKAFPIVISTAALLISILTLVLGNFLKVDSLKYVLTGTGYDYEPVAYLQGSYISLKPKFNMTFINIGTRPVAIREFQLELFQSGVDKNEKCAGVSESQFSYSFELEPFVIQKGEILSKELNKESKNKWKIAVENQKKETFAVVGCLLFITNTPDSLSMVREIPLFEQEVRKDGKQAMATNLFVDVDRSKPSSLIDEWQLRLW